MPSNDRSRPAEGWFPDHPLSRELTSLIIGIAIGIGTFAGEMENAEPASAALSTGLAGGVIGFLTFYSLMLLTVGFHILRDFLRDE